MSNIEQAISVGSAILTPGSGVHIGDIHVENAGVTSSPPEPHDFTDIRNAKSDTPSTSSSPRGDADTSVDTLPKRLGSPEPETDSATNSYDPPSSVDSSNDISRLRDKDGDIHVENAGAAGVTSSPLEPHDFTDIRNAKSDTQSTSSSPRGDADTSVDTLPKRLGSPEPETDSATNSYDPPSSVDSSNDISRLRDKRVSSAVDRKVTAELSETAARRRRRCLIILSFFPFLAASIVLGLYVLTSRSPSDAAEPSYNEGDNMAGIGSTSDDAFLFQPPTTNGPSPNSPVGTATQATTAATTSAEETPKSQLVLEEDTTASVSEENSSSNNNEGHDAEESLIYSSSSTGEVEGAHGNLRATTSPTMSPIQNNNTATAFIIPALINVGNNNEPMDVYPLQHCEGDCDTDEDCEGSLTCFDRAAIEVVPGCSGLGSYGVDYCANLDLLDENVETSLYVPLLASVGNDGEPKEAYPLHDCQGDCDEDNDCAGSLVCFKRDGNDPVPGCSGQGIIGSDYCTSVEAIGGMQPSSSDIGGEADTNGAELSSQNGNLRATMSPTPAPSDICIADGQACPTDKKLCCSQMCSKDKEETGEKVCGEIPAEEQTKEDAVVANDTCVPSGEACPNDKKQCCESMCTPNKETGEKVCGTWTESIPWYLEAGITAVPVEEICTKPGDDCIDKKLCCSQKCIKYEEYMTKAQEANGEKVEKVTEQDKENQKREVCE